MHSKTRVAVVSLTSGCVMWNSWPTRKWQINNSHTDVSLRTVISSLILCLFPFFSYSDWWRAIKL